MENTMEQKLRRDCNMGENLKKLRKMNGYSQEKLCAELQRRSCDMGRTTYEKYEARIKYPHQRTYSTQKNLWLHL